MSALNRLLLIGLMTCAQMINAVVKLPTNFYSLTVEKNKAVKSVSIIDISDTEPIFFIVVPDSSLQSNTPQERVKELFEFAQDITVPADFFASKKPSNEKKPVILYLAWDEQENTQVRKRAAQDLATGIDSLRYRFKSSQFIVLGHGQGGNIINSASQQIRIPLEVVINLSTPIFPHTQDSNTPDIYSDYLPNPKKINRLFCYYSDQDFRVIHPTLHPRYEHTYANGSHPNLSNVLLLVNNKHPLTHETLRPLVGKKIVQLSKKITESYRNHTHFIAHISSSKPETDMLVFLPESTVVACADKATSDLVTQEQILSKVRIQKFEKEWGRPLATTLKSGEKSRMRYQSVKLASTI